MGGDAGRADTAAHRSNNFDAMRMLAALMVLLSHQYLLSGRKEIRIYGIYSLGDLGVAMFFAISGFLVSTSWRHDPHLWRFLVRRFLRIYPALAVVVLLMAFAMGPLFTPLSLSAYVHDPRFAAFFQNLMGRSHTDLPVAMAPGPFTHIVNGSLWTIPLEVRCYVLLSLLGMARLLHRRWTLLALVLAFSAYYIGLLDSGFFLIRGDDAGRSLQLEFIACFFLGACMAAFPKALQAKRLGLLVCCAFLLHLLALATGKPAFAIWLAAPLLVLAFGRANWPLLRSFGRYGDWSYGIYLYAFPVQQTVILVAPAWLPFLAQLVLATVLTFLCAAASWHGIEKHALRLKPSARTQAALQRSVVSAQPGA